MRTYSDNHEGNLISSALFHILYYCKAIWMEIKRMKYYCSRD